MSHKTKSGVDSRHIRRLQKALGCSYTQALRELEKIDKDRHEAYVAHVETLPDTDTNLEETK